jgi:hypothetical protein
MAGMDEQRARCAFMSGPLDADLDVSAAKWWFAISRDILAQSYRRESTSLRTPAMCHRTPTFTSPLKEQR